MCNFRVGQKVAATEDLECGVAKGAVLTISAINSGNFIGYDGQKQLVSLLFEEVKPRARFGGFDPRFFRPVVTRKTDISCFTKLLNPHKQEQNA